MNYSLWAHTNWTSNVDIFEWLSILKQNYLILFANPKSAIFGFPFFIKTLAVFKSLCIICYLERYLSP
jgi:hypothetical protein